MTRSGMFLGVDGGGTKTEFVCIDADAVQRGSFRTGTTYHLEVGVDEVLARLRAGIDATCRGAGVTPTELDYVFFGLPGFGEDRLVDPQLAAACGALLGHARYRCDNDMVCGWAGSLACEDGINIVAGTGSIGYGQYRDRGARAGGWGDIFGDEGSAHWIALRGLTIFSRMSDGRLPRGPLHRRLVAALDLTHDIDLCQLVLGPPTMSRAAIAALAPHVVAAADEGDGMAAAILARAADHLVALAEAVRSELAFAADRSVALSWSGSILTSVPAVRSRFVDLIERGGRFHAVSPRTTPGHGAALYARKLAGAGSATPLSS